MTELLSRADYGAIAAGLSLPAAPFIDGKYQRGRGPTLPLPNPATGETLKQISTALAGGVADGLFVPSTIYEVTRDDPCAREEIFGPILSVLTVASTDEAVALANDTAYGLAASVFTANVRTALRAARDIRAGTVTVKCFGEGDSATPFGGYKQSGFGGRDNGVHAHDQYTELKTIWIDLSDPAAQDNVT